MGLNIKMDKKLKVIHIEHCSHSYFVSDDRHPDEVVKGSWGTQVAREVKRFYPEIDVEAWFPEKIEEVEREFEYLGVKMKIFPTTFSPMYALDFSWPMIKALQKEIKKCKRENKKLIIHIHEYHNLHGLAMATLFKNQNLIAQHHGGSWPLKHLRQTRKYRWFFPLFLLGQLWENKVLKNIKVFFALSQEEVDYLKKKALHSEIRFQTMGIEDDYFKKVGKKTARKGLGLDLNKKIFVFIGRINEVKGVGYLLDAMKELKDVDLKIIGYLQNVEKFKKYARDNKLNNVEFLGGIFGEEKMLYLSSADALILPSSKEGAPVTVMEAIAKNTPAIVTNVGGVGLMIEDGREGLIIKQKDPKDIVKAVRQMIKKPLKGVRKYGEKYKWESIIDETIEEYEKL